MSRFNSRLGLTALLACLGTAGAHASTIQITEWMYNGLGSGSIGEFVEFTNTGSASIDMTGWSFDDNSRLPGSQSLTAFGVVAPGESVILTDDTAAAFRAHWGLDATVKVIGGNGNNLGRADEINLYNASNALVDRLTYDDQTLGGPRTNGVSATIAFANLGMNNASTAVTSVNGDFYGSHVDSLGEVGNPGLYTPLSAVPLPASIWLLGSGLGALGAFRRRRRTA